jgi:hypothetical protein
LPAWTGKDKKEPGAIILFNGGGFVVR